MLLGRRSSVVEYFFLSFVMEKLIHDMVYVVICTINIREKCDWEKGQWRESITVGDSFEFVKIFGALLCLRNTREKRDCLARIF